MDFLFYITRKKHLKEYLYIIYKMNIYYTNPFFDKLPYEIQNHICSFLPPHPIKNMFEDEIVCLISNGVFFDLNCNRWERFASTYLNCRGEYQPRSVFCYVCKKFLNMMSRGNDGRGPFKCKLCKFVKGKKICKADETDE